MKAAIYAETSLISVTGKAEPPSLVIDLWYVELIFGGCLFISG